jgi:hypothetical protein
LGNAGYVISSFAAFVAFKISKIKLASQIEKRKLEMKG